MPSPKLVPARPKVFIDLTPVVPGGENGGLKMLALKLVEYFRASAPQWNFVLLTARISHDELAYLDASNVERRCILENGSSEPSANTTAGGGRRRHLMRAARMISRILPDRVYQRLLRTYDDFRYNLNVRGTNLELDGDLLFCPFLAPTPGWPAYRPIVSLVVDLQFKYYGEFFSVEDRRARDRAFQAATRRARHFICISEYTRSTVQEHSDLDPKQTETIHIGLASRFGELPVATVAAATMKHVGANDRFLLYPANYWRHKNHAMLVTAFAKYVARNPESELKLVLTGAETGEAKSIRHAIEKMGLTNRVVMTGYVSDEELGSLMRLSTALIYPSLFEGFGMPPVEAMAMGKPVLSSKLTCLPEILGDAAIYFDPRRPVEIVEAIEQLIASTPEDLAKFAVRGRRRAAEIGTPESMGSRYLAVFANVLRDRLAFQDGLHGVFNDGWTSGRFVVTHSAAERRRDFKLKARSSSHVPQPKIRVQVVTSDGVEDFTLEVGRNREISLERSLPPEGGYLEFTVDPIFCPAEAGIANDPRRLGLICTECKLYESGQPVDLLHRAS